MDAQRAILHVDMNNFYASVECLHNPGLRGRPVAVGGDLEKRHGIILAKNYEARSYGIKTGEALWQARNKCPGLVVVAPHYALYLRFSRLAREIYEDYTDQIEPFGVDECWLDVTGGRLIKSNPLCVADDIRRRVKRELGVTASVGVSFNKVFAKLGSDMKKPDAITELSRENYRLMAWPLPANKLLYVGAATGRKLKSRGVYTIGALANTDPALLQSWLGKWGLVLHAFANGQDSSPVRRIGQESVIKSVGNSTTTPRDVNTEDEAKIVLCTLADSVAARLRDYGFKCRTVQITLRGADLMSFERQMKLSRPTNLSRELLNAAMALLRAHCRYPLRSLGLRACGLIPGSSPSQLSFFDDSVREETLERAVDGIRARFGHNSIRRGLTYADPMGRLDARGENVVHPVGFFAP